MNTASSSSQPAGGIGSTTTTTNAFKSSIRLQTKRPSTRAFVAEAGGAGDGGTVTTDASEARYWSEKFGLGGGGAGGTVPKYAHPRRLTVKAGTSAIVHQVLFAPPPPSNGGGGSGGSATTNHPMAVVCGPRVKLYGTTPQSAFHRRLSQPQNSKSAARQQLLQDAEDGGGGTGGVDDVPADRQVQTGGDLALCAAYRNGDGRLLAVGTDRGDLRIADVSTRAALCTFSTATSAAGGGRLPIRAVAWLRDGQSLVAAGDDGVARVWSLSNAMTGAAPVVSLAGHGDSVRSVAVWQMPIQQKKKAPATASAEHQLWPYRSVAATASYDHTIRLWNLDGLEATAAERTNGADRCLSVLLHGGPVEALLTLPSSDPANVPFWLVSAGGTTVKVWNPRTGTCVCVLRAHHRKTLTSLVCVPRVLDPDDPGTTTVTRIVTGGLDGLLRIHSWNAASGTLRLLHGVALPHNTAITALAVSPNSNGAARIAIGTSSGLVMVRQRGPSWTTPKRPRPKAGTYAFFTRGMNANALAGDFVVGEGATKKRKLKNYDLALKQFRYGEALDEALETRIPQVVVAVLEELGKRRGLTIALSNRDEESLEPVLSFLVRYIGRPRFAALLIGVASQVLEIYGDDISGQSEVIDEVLDKLRNQVTLEARTQRKLLRVVGQIDAIVASMTSTTGP